MAPKIAASNALKTYLTNKPDKKDLILTFLWLFRGLMIQMSKMENWFKYLDGVQDGRHFKAKFNLITVDNYFPIIFNNGCFWRI